MESNARLSKPIFKISLPPVVVMTVLVFSNCKIQNPRSTFDAQPQPTAPQYTSLQNWAAHPDKKDLADLTPTPAFQNVEASAAADVFFLYPTTFTGDKKTNNDRRAWNASVADARLNRKTDESAIQFQASIFNGAGRVFAPRYRQAHYFSFVTKKDKNSAEKALELAYSDVRAAFEHYLKNWNGGRPIIIAGHSQGAKHAMRLLREFFEGKPLGEQLVAAYLVGWPVPRDYFSKIKPCETPDQTSCFCSWRTFERKYGKRKAFETNVLCTNPVCWTTEENRYAPRSEHRGAILFKFNKPLPQICDAEVHKGVLLCSRPRFPGSFLVRTKNYHVGDLNLYYFDVRENASRRAGNFSKK